MRLYDGDRNWYANIEEDSSIYHTFMPRGNLSYALWTSGASGLLQAYPIVINFKKTLNRIGTNIRTVSAAGTDRYGIYLNKPDQFYPGKLLVDGGNITTVVGYCESTIPDLLLTPRLYWFAHRQSTAFANVEYRVPPRIHPLGGFPDQGFGTSGNFYALKLTGSGALPDPFPDSASFITQNYALIIMRKA